MSTDDPAAVRAAIERQIAYLGDQVHRIDGDHAEIQGKLEGAMAAGGGGGLRAAYCL